MYHVNRQFIFEGFAIISTSAFVNRSMYPRYNDMLGRIRRNGGFDTIIFDKHQNFIGVEVKPEFSLIEFKHALGQTIVDLIDNSREVDEAMIVMPHKNLPIEDQFKNKFAHILKCLGFPITMKYIELPCRKVN